MRFTFPPFTYDINGEKIGIATRKLRQKSFIFEAASQLVVSHSTAFRFFL